MRIVTSAAAGRPVYYDRNPVSKQQNYAAVVGPHTATTRWTYTVPANKKAYLELLFNFRRRETVAGTPAEVNGYFAMNPAAAGFQTFQQNPDFANVAGGTGISQTLTQFGELNAGDVITYSTYDASTGGTNQFIGYIKYTEFDA